MSEEGLNSNTTDNNALDSNNQVGSSQVAGGKLWERALDNNEIRNLSQNWSLAGDAGLLLRLQEFSQKIISRTHEAEKLVEELAHDTKGSSCSVHNIFNEFLMLSNSQFIENRVYDEEVGKEAPQEKESTKQKTREELEAEIVPRFGEAVDLGIKVLDDAFITVEIKATADSEDEDDESALPAGYLADPILELRDVYSHRPLPYLIGTAEFFHDEMVGLQPDDSDDETNVKTAGKEDSDDDDDDNASSESESGDAESESEYSETSSDEEEDDKISKKVKSKPVVSSDEETSEEEDLFGDKPSKKKSSALSVSDESDDTDGAEDDVTAKPKSKVDLQSELAAKLGLPQSKPMASTNEKSTNQDDDDEPGLQNDTATPDTLSPPSSSQRKHRKGSKTRSDSNADTISVASNITTASVASKKSKKHRERTRTNDSAKKPKGSKKKKEVNEEEDLFAPQQKEDDLFEDESPFGKKGGLFSGAGSLFDDKSEEGDLFGDTGDGDTDRSNSPRRNTTDDEIKEIKPRARTTSSGKKVPAGAVSIFGDGMFPGDKSPEKPSSRPSSPAKDASPSAKKTAPPIVKGLFDDDNDDLFGDNKDSLTVSAPPPRKKTLELFADDEDDIFNEPKTNKQTEIKEKSKVPAGGVSVFAPASLPKKEIAKDVKPLPKSEAKPAAKTALSLFDDEADEDEDDLFGDAPVNKPSPSVKTKQNAPKLSLFDDDEEEDVNNGDDLFSIQPNQPIANQKEIKSPKSKVEHVTKEKSLNESKTNTKTDVAKPTPKKSTPLLGDSDDDDLFGTKPSKVTPSKKQEKKPANLGLFSDDDDGLFGGESEDIFAAKSVDVKQKAASTKIESSVSTSAESTNESQIAASPDRSRGSIASQGQPSDPLATTETKRENNTEQKDEEDGPNVRRPAGGVSLFGGVDPFAAKNKLKQSNVTSNEKTTKENIKTDEHLDKPSPEVSAKPPQINEKDIFDDDDEDDLFGNLPTSKPSPHKKSQTLPVPSKKPVDRSPAASPSTKPAFAAAKLNFNPAAMLPGAAPPPKKIQVDDVVSFDEPAKVDTLTTATKNRTRGTLQRRPPSRQGRQKAIRSSVADDTLFPSPAIDSIDAGRTASPITSRPAPTKSMTLPSQSSTKTKPNISTIDIFDDDDDDDDLFGIPSKQTAANSKPPPLLDDKSGDLFGLPTNQPLASRDIETKQEGVTSSIDSTTSEEPAVEDKNKSLPPSRHTETKQENALSPEDSLFAPSKDDNDIFGNVKPSPKIEKQDPLFGDTIPTTPKAVTKPTKEETKVESTPKKKAADVIDIFGDDNDDIFAVQPSSSKSNKTSTTKSSKSKKANIGLLDDDIFGDTKGASIFDETPVKSRKEKKPASSLIANNDEDDDDLFSTKKTTKSDKSDIISKPEAKSTTKSKGATATSSSIFDDDSASIFDDPLNAFK